MRVVFTYDGSDDTAEGVTRIMRKSAGGFVLSFGDGNAVEADTIEVVDPEPLDGDEEHLQRAYSDLDAIRTDAEQALTALAVEDAQAAESKLEAIRDRGRAWSDPPAEVTE